MVKTIIFLFEIAVLVILGFIFSEVYMLKQAHENSRNLHVDVRVVEKKEDGTLLLTKLHTNGEQETQPDGAEEKQPAQSAATEDVPTDAEVVRPLNLDNAEPDKE